MVTLLQIGGLINLEERSGSFLPELPYTNRGVIRQKEELSALIDWCQITIKEVPLEAVIEDVLRIPLELMTVTGYEKGIAGHEVVAIFDNIKVLKPTGNAGEQMGISDGKPYGIFVQCRNRPDIGRCRNSQE